MMSCTGGRVEDQLASECSGLENARVQRWVRTYIVVLIVTECFLQPIEILHEVSDCRRRSAQGSKRKRGREG
jgi:hypothetical protein